jgi:mRNA interferase MazF
MVIKQYDVVLVNLEPALGSEINKTRPCVVISPDEMNRYLRTIIIAPLTSSVKDYPTRIKVDFDEKICSIAVDQIKTIDKLRIMKLLGRISDKEIINLKIIMKETFVD